MGKSHIYTETEIQMVRDLYPMTLTSELSKMVGITIKQCYYIAYKLGLKKDNEWLQQMLKEKGVECMEKNLKKYQFKKGITAHNKGKRMSDEVREKVKHTWFKKGSLPHNTLYDGAESIRTDKTGRQYIHVRIAKAKWVLKHILIWENAHGKVPKGYNVIFKDGNTLNVALENLEMISNRQLMERNCCYNKYPVEVARLMQLKGVLKRQLNKHSKNNKNG